MEPPGVEEQAFQTELEILFSTCELERFIPSVQPMEDQQTAKINITVSATEITDLADDVVEKLPLLRVYACAHWVEFSKSSKRSDIDAAILYGDMILDLISYRGDISSEPKWTARIGIMLFQRFRHYDQVEDIHRSIDLMERSVSLSHDDNIDKAWRLCNLGLCYRYLYGRRGQLKILYRAIEIFEKAAPLISESEANLHQLCTLLHNLGAAYRELYENVYDTASINRSVNILKHAVQLTPKGAFKKPHYLDDLALSYQCLAMCAETPKDLEKSVECAEEALVLFPGDSIDRSIPLNTMATSLLLLFNHTLEPGCLWRAVSLLSEALSLAPGNAIYLTNLSSCYQRLFELTGQEEHLDPMISCITQANTRISEDDPDKPECLSNLGHSYRMRFDHFDNPEDIDQAISFYWNAYKLALSMNHRFKCLCLCNVGVSYRCRFRHSGQKGDLEEAIKYQEEAVSMAPNNFPDMKILLSNLGSSYQCLFTVTGDLQNVNKSIDCMTEVIKSTSDSHPYKPSRLNTLALAYSRRFEHTNFLEDLQEAHRCIEQAVLLTPEGHPEQPGRLSNLGNSYRAFFEFDGRLEHLDKSIILMEQAVQRTPSHYPDRPTHLNNLANAYQRLFQRLGNLEDLDRAAECYNEAVQLAANHTSDKPQWLSNLAALHEHRYKRLGELKDLDLASKYLEQALSLPSDNKMNKPLWLSSLGTVWQSYFEQSGRFEDLARSIVYQENALSQMNDENWWKPALLAKLGDKAIELGEQAVTLKMHNDSLKPILLTALGRFYLVRFEESYQGKDQEIAVQHFKTASLMPSGSPGTRLEASRLWGMYSFDSNSSLEAYKNGMNLLPQVVWLGVSVHRRYESLSTEVHDVVNRAVVSALAWGNHCLAIEWLEEGRAFVWTQMLQLRDPSDTLFTAHPEIAKQLQQISHGIEQVNMENTAILVPENVTRIQKAAQKLRQLALDRDTLIHKVRTLPGFSNFLQAKPFSELSLAAKSSAIAVIIVHRVRSDAIVLLPGVSAPVHVELPLFSTEKAVKAYNQLSSSVESSNHRQHSSRRPIYYSEKTQNCIRAVLLILWTDIVQPVINALGYMNSGTDIDEDRLPRITWCTTGPLAFLPLHAAGCYDNPHDRAYNYIISSYTPTLSALLKPPRLPSGFQGVLAVGQEAAKGSEPLPGTTTELDHVQKCSRHVKLTRIEGGFATVNAVLGAMEQHSWVHLACHAAQDASNPIASAFQLCDGNLALAELTRKPLPYADFAFLSACETATGDAKLPDEAVHLAAGMLMVGYSNVIATMWSIKDQDAPLVAEIVYSHLLKGEPDSRKAAVALHHALKRLRNSVGEKEFTRWIPFVHVGC